MKMTEPGAPARRDGPRILGVNPPIHDFAAYDFWARPLGLLQVLGVLREAGYRVSCFDAMGKKRPGTAAHARFGCAAYAKSPIPKPGIFSDVPRTFSRYGMGPEEMLEGLSRLPRPDAVLVTCLMTYWYPGAFEAIRVLRRAFPGVPVALGGTYARLYPEHARRFSGADTVSEASEPREILDLAGDMTGAACEPPWGDCRKSPFLPAAPDLLGEWPFLPLETSRGCPFSCSYCASSLLSTGFFQKQPGEVLSEILFWNREKGVRDFAFYDDALLVNAEDHLHPLLEKIIARGLSLRLHTPNAVHGKWFSKKTANLLRRAGCKTLRLGVETADFGKNRTLDKKISVEEFLCAAKNARDAGFDRSSAGAYLLAGLPGQGDGAVESAIRLVRKAGLRPILAHYTPIPGTALFPEAQKASRYDLSEEPLATNNAAFPCRKSLSWEWITRLKKLAREEE